MPKSDPRIDAYIARAQPFAQPVLKEVRKRVHAAIGPVEETMKWSMPFFVRGKEILATMAGFKAHARFGVWVSPTTARAGKVPRSVPHFVKLTTRADIPSVKALRAMISKTAAANVAAKKKPAAKKKKA